eukprot:c16162_g1_i1.p1 GENE.c16162_g1_i1~~c16162_g1_i1.p1  ORF type:complete len:156 (-),score=17.58 c16162_g1_i1:66-533(-)
MHSAWYTHGTGPCSAQQRAFRVLAWVWLSIGTFTLLAHLETKWSEYKYARDGIRLVDCYYNPVSGRYEHVTDAIRRNPMIFIDQQPAHLVHSSGQKKTGYRPSGAATVRRPATTQTIKRRKPEDQKTDQPAQQHPDNSNGEPNSPPQTTTDPLPK